VSASAVPRWLVDSCFCDTAEQDFTSRFSGNHSPACRWIHRGLSRPNHENPQTSIGLRDDNDSRRGPIKLDESKGVESTNLRVLIVLMVFSLVFGNWVERDGPLTPRVVGTIANLGLTWLLVKNLRWLRTKSK
jgi:hypothetical protein